VELHAEGRPETGHDLELGRIQRAVADADRRALQDPPVSAAAGAVQAEDESGTHGLSEASRISSSPTPRFLNHRGDLRTFPSSAIETLLDKLSKNTNVTTSPVLNTAIQPTYVYARHRAEQRHGEQRCAQDTQR
jgi:hypothetical protein